ncbi:MAG: NERD domain-containing protein [Polyangiaceae bacterium]|nr:NERD domain-containing protein [Polyangiaceae bacterium]
MARLIPQVDPSSIENCGERVVAEALVSQLPGDWLIYHSYPWLRRERDGRGPLREGEIDFVLFHPVEGLLVLEVKGGDIRFDSPTHDYFRQTARGRQEIKNPFEQARDSLYVLEKSIKAHPAARGVMPCSYGYAVVLPDTQWRGSLPADATRETLICAPDLARLGDAVRTATAAWRRGPAQAITSSGQQAVLESLSPHFQLTPVLWRSLDDQADRIRRLTEEQQRLLGFMGGRNRAAIEGVAGSGKTLLALAQAQRFARERGCTLFLCYNRALAEWLRSQLPGEYANTLVIDTFHGLCEELCRKAQIAFSSRDEDDAFWNDRAPELLEQARAALPSEAKFEALVCDEGQDFRTLWWLVLPSVMNGPDFAWFVFYDPKQNIFIEKPAIPSELGEPFRLEYNCRNTRAITRRCSNVLGTSIAHHPEAPEGERPKVVEAANGEDVIRRTRQQILEWCERDRGAIAPSRVAVLVAEGGLEAWPKEFGATKLVRGLDGWRAGKGALLSTARRFKGLEADAIVLAGVPRNDAGSPYTTADHYVAVSRARMLLVEVIDLSRGRGGLG